MIRRLLMTAAIIGLAATAPVFAEDDAATTAVNAAKQYSGTSITVVAEAGLQALLDTRLQLTPPLTAVPYRDWIEHPIFP